MTIGAVTKSVSLKSMSSSPWRFPGEAYEKRPSFHSALAIFPSKTPPETHLLLQPKLRCLLPLPRLRRPYLHLQLLRRQRVPQERLRRVHGERHAGQAALACAAELLEDRVRVEDMRRDVLRVGSVC